MTGYLVTVLDSGCAQIGMPTGGPRDTAAPVLIRSSPEQGKLNFEGNKISFTFNEYIEVKELQSNLLVSPLPKTSPSVNYNLKTVTLKFRDTLRPNTTYSINFGDAIRDINEGNILQNFVYTFSTGSTIDSLELDGKVFIAETGKPDSTLSVLLYLNAPDSAVSQRKPDYMARVKGDGSFHFYHLPAGNFKLYALKDGDGGKTYNSKNELFAFADKEFSTTNINPPITLYAYAEEKASPPTPTPPAQKKSPEKKLRYAMELPGGKQDLLQPLQLSFNTAVKNFDSTGPVLSDTNFVPYKNVSFAFDSTRKKLSVYMKWQAEMPFILTLPKEALDDSLDNTLSKSDTIRFTTKSMSDYGKVVLRFKNTDLQKQPVLQFLELEKVKFSYPLTGPEWSNNLFPPGEYELRILYDDNGNGKWDPGNYTEKKQPEKAITIKQKLSVRADWENERDIEL
jgi:hypothetical protein